MASAIDQQTGLPQGFVLDAPPIQQDIQQTVDLPEGFILDEPEQEELGLLGSISERLGKRADIFEELTAAPPESNIESLGKGFQLLGNVVAGGALDIVGETVSAGFANISKLASALTPDAIEGPVSEKVKEIFTSAVGTDVAQAGISAASQGIEAYQEWAQANPEAAKNIDAAANLALVALPVKGAPKGGGLIGPPKQGRLLRGAAALDKTIDTKQKDFIADLVSPVKTKAVLEDEAKRSVRGKFGTTEVIPSAKDVSLSNAVSRVDGVKAGNTLVQNQNAIQAANLAEGKNLAVLLKDTKVKIPRAEIKKAMDGVVKTLELDPLIVGDAVKTGEKLLKNAKSILDKHPNTPSGVLAARKEFDALVRKQKPKAFNPATENAMSTALRETRQAMNGIIEKAAPSVTVRESLNFQSNLFAALDNIAPKVAKEANTVIGRLGENVIKSLGGKGVGLTKSILSSGAFIGTAIVSPQAAAGVIGAGLAAKGAQKLATSATTKKAISKLLRLTDEAIRKSTAKGATDLVKALRADRAALIEISKGMEGEQ